MMVGAKYFMTMALAMTLPVAASAREPGTYWKAETKGSPMATQIGEWTESEDGRKVRLEITGGHALGDETYFVAGWVAPYTSPNETPDFETAYELTNINEIGEDIRLVLMFRYRYREGPWSRWDKQRRVLQPGVTWSGGGSDMIAFSKRQMQFEWRLKGFISAPTYLEGYFELHVN